MVQCSPLFIDLQGLYRHRGRNGVPGIGEAMGEYAYLLALPHQRIKDSAGNHRGRHWLVARRELLRHGDDVGPDFERLKTETRTKPPEPANDLVGDEQHVVLFEDWLDLVEVG